jgi:hypothetical protein
VVNPATSYVKTLQKSNTFSFLKKDTVPVEKSIKEQKVGLKWWLTSQYSDVNYFIIIPFSKVFYIWNAIMLITFSYVSFKVLFGIGWD